MQVRQEVDDPHRFSANNGAFTLTTSTDSSGTQSCELHIGASIPAGYSLKLPVFSTSGYALRNEDSAPPTQVALTYQLGGTSLTSQHEIPSALTTEDESDSYVLVDTPRLAIAACNDASEPEDVDLTIKVEATIPDGTTFRLTSIDGDFDLGVQWYECPQRALE
jgi:hypothetical protein